MSFATFCGTDPTNAATYQRVLTRYLEGGGGGGVAAVTEGVLGNISIPNPLVPFVSVRNPLNAVLNLGTQSITGTTGSITLVNAVGTSQSILNANQLRIQDTAVAANGILLTETSLVVAGSAGAETITYGSSNIVKTGGNMGISAPTGLSINAGVGVNINSGTAPVQITQPLNTTSKLTTNIANVNYYADYVIDNANSTAVVNIPPPNYNGQRLTCIARGIAPLISWVPFGNLATTASPNGVYATLLSSQNEVWVARTDSATVEVWDAALSAIQATIVLAGGAERCYVLYEAGGFMFIGGSFTQIGATSQNGLGRCNVTAPYAEDKMLDTVNNHDGVDTTVGVNGVYALEVQGAYLYAGGTFSQFVPTAATANNFFRVEFYTSPTNAQLYTEVGGGTNAPVYALLNTGTYLFVGGDFTSVGPNAYNYCATWDGLNWGFTDSNSFNNTVTVLESVNFVGVFVGGGFTHSPQAYSCYLDYNVPTAANQATNLSIANPLTRGCSFYNGTTYVNTQTDGTFSSNTLGVWVSEGSAGNATPSFFGSFNGTLNVAWVDAVGYYKRDIPAQTSTFTLTSGNFEFNNNATYTTATIIVPDVAQSWIGVDVATAPKWIQIAYNPYLNYT